MLLLISLFFLLLQSSHVLAIDENPDNLLIFDETFGNINQKKTEIRNFKRSGLSSFEWRKRKCYKVIYTYIQDTKLCDLGQKNYGCKSQYAVEQIRIAPKFLKYLKELSVVCAEGHFFDESIADLVTTGDRKNFDSIIRKIKSGKYFQSNTSIAKNDVQVNINSITKKTQKQNSSTNKIPQVKKTETIPVKQKELKMVNNNNQKESDVSNQSKKKSIKTAQNKTKKSLSEKDALRQKLKSYGFVFSEEELETMYFKLKQQTNKNDVQNSENENIAQKQNPESKKKAEAEKKKLEAKKKAEAEKKKLEAEKKAEAEKKKLEAEKKAQAEKKKLDAKKKAEAEKKKLKTKKKAEEEREPLETNKTRLEAQNKVQEKKIGELQRNAEQDNNKKVSKTQLQKNDYAQSNNNRANKEEVKNQINKEISQGECAGIIELEMTCFDRDKIGRINFVKDYRKIKNKICGGGLPAADYRLGRTGNKVVGDIVEQDLNKKRFIVQEQSFTNKVEKIVSLYDFDKKRRHSNFKNLFEYEDCK